MTTGSDLRIGDADREAVANSLRESYAQGRLTIEEFRQRLDACFAATTQSQLSRVTADLPRLPAPPVPLPVATAGQNGDRAGGYGGRERPRGSRPRRGGTLAAVLAVMAAWVLVFSALGPHLRMFPFFPGKLAIFVFAFAIIRGLLRRIFGFGRGGRGCGRYRGGPWR